MDIFSLFQLCGGLAFFLFGMGNLYEFDAGSASGWCYAVNGDRPNVGCSSYSLSDGDDIVFEYTLNLGEDT